MADSYLHICECLKSSVAQTLSGWWFKGRPCYPLRTGDDHHPWTTMNDKLIRYTMMLTIWKDFSMFFQIIGRYVSPWSQINVINSAMFVRQEALAKPPFASQEQWQLLRDEAAPVPSTAEAVVSRYISIPGRLWDRGWVQTFKFIIWLWEETCIAAATPAVLRYLGC